MDVIRFRESADYPVPLTRLMACSLLPLVSRRGASVNEQEQYEDVARRLAVYKYDIFLDLPGYIVQHRTDNKDVSRMRDLDDLIEFAHLIEWREQRQTLTER
jgi:hypothetical protein